MRFRIKDLLLLTALLSVYLAAFVHIYNSTENKLHIFIAAPAPALCFPCLIFFQYCWNIRKAKTIVCRLNSPFPWRPLFLFLALVVVPVAVVPQSLKGVLAVSMFAGASGPFLGILTGYLLLPGHVLVSHRGIIYLTFLLPWDQVSVLHDSKGVIEKIRISKHRRSPAINVPLELAEVIKKLLADYHSEGTEKIEIP